MRCLRFLSILLWSTVVAEAADGGRPELSPALRDAIQDSAKRGVWSSVEIGVIHGGKQSRWLISADAVVEDDEATQRARYELGAVTAVYTGVLLAEMASRGVVHVGDALQKFLPDGVRCADPKVCALTLQQLATHRSGLPALPPNLFPRDDAQPFAGYAESALVEFLKTYRLPDQVASGQTLDAALLGWALGRADGTGYVMALRERVLRPLGMDRTDFDDAALMPGTHLGVRSRGPHRFDGLAAAAALRSDLTDQLKFLRANLKPGDLELRPALLLARQGGTGEPAAAFGLGWRLLWVKSDEQEWPLLWQKGSGGGHSSFLGFRSDRQEGVVVLADSTADVSRIGLAMLRDTDPPAFPPGIRQLPLADLQAYVGLYEIGAGQELIVRASAGGLSAQAPGQLALPLYCIDTDLFTYIDIPIQLFFQRSRDQRVESLRVVDGIVNYPAQRLSSGVPRIARTPIEVAPERSRALIGDYRVDANTLVRIDQQEDGLRFQLTATTPRALFAYAEDRYASADGELDLLARRAVDGQVTALVLTLFGKARELQRVASVDSAGAESMDSAKQSTLGKSQ